jgi:hypothetical protein
MLAANEGLSSGGCRGSRRGLLYEHPQPSTRAIRVPVCGALFPKRSQSRSSPLARRPERVRSFASRQITKSRELSAVNGGDLGLRSRRLVFEYIEFNRICGSSRDLVRRGRAEFRENSDGSGRGLPVIFFCRIIRGHGRGWPGPPVIPRRETFAFGTSRRDRRLPYRPAGDCASPRPLLGRDRHSMRLDPALAWAQAWLP